MHCFAIAFAVMGPAVAEDISFRDMDKETRRDWILAQAEEYRIRVAESKEFAERQRPLLRFNDGISGVVDAIQFVWTDKGRPEVAASFWYRQDGLKAHEFVTLSRGTLHATRGDRKVWSPVEPGFAFTAVPRAPPPAKSSAARLTQMRQIARRCEAWELLAKQDFHLRLLPQPLIRYTPEGESILDGAIFSYAKGTNPEVLLIVELVAGEGVEPHYEYTCARMTARRCWLLMDGEEVWRVGYNGGDEEQGRYRNIYEYETAPAASEK